VTGSAGDLSLKMFSILATGIALWLTYGILQVDFVIIVTNAVNLCLLGRHPLFQDPRAPIRMPKPTRRGSRGGFGAQLIMQ
jgi:hypothetical protein